MRERVSDAGRRLLAFAILVVAAYIVFKLVVGAVSAVLWVALLIAALFAVIWALRVL